MTKITKRTQQAFQDFHDTMTEEQDKLKTGLNSLVRKSAVDAESKMRQKEAVEIKNIETEMEKPDEIKEAA